MSARDQALDEVLGLNCAWYADILMALSADRPVSAPGIKGKALRFAADPAARSFGGIGPRRLTLGCPATETEYPL
jgi:hypothetical protein